MASKIKVLKLIILFIVLCLLIFISLARKTNVEVNLIKTLIPKVDSKQEYFYKAADKNSSKIKIVFEDENDPNKVKEKFIEKLDLNDFEINEINFSKLLNNYLISPSNFISINKRELLKNKKYDEIYNESLVLLYDPLNVQLTNFEDDPYFFLNDFLIQNSKNNEIKDEKYDFISIKIKEENGLSPDTTNKKIEKIINIKKEIEKEGAKIYLSGTPIHSYSACQKSKISINLISILSGLLILSLTYFYFKNLKLIIPITFTVLFGMLSGYCAVKLWFLDFQILTLVFSTTLIGIGIDYSYHYFFKKENDKDFKKNLTISFITTIVPFLLLYFTKIELLKQISIFTIFGLFSIYIIVLIYYPLFNFEKPINKIKINSILYKSVLVLLLIFSFIGLFQFKFNDSLDNLYSPTKELLKAEKLYSSISGEDYKNVKTILVFEKDFQKRLEKEEEIEDYLYKKGINFYSMSKFIPSYKRQKENFDLAKKLYENNLDKYKNILADSQINKIKNKPYKSVEFNLESYPYLNDFIIDNNVSVIYAFSDKKISLDNNIYAVDIKGDIENYLLKYRKILEKTLPFVIFSTAFILALFFGLKKSLKIMAPPLFGGLFGVILSGVFNNGVNMFNLIALYMVLGFTVDYSIFRLNSNNDVEDAIFISSVTTAFSFLLLSFSGFKLLSSISLVIFFGILFSYLIGYFILKRELK